MAVTKILARNAQLDQGSIMCSMGENRGHIFDRPSRVTRAMSTNR